MGEYVASRLTAAPGAPSAGFSSLYPVGASDAAISWSFIRPDGSVGRLLVTTANSMTSAELAAAVSDETGSGPLVFATSPSIASPIFSNYVDFIGVTNPLAPAAGVARFHALTTQGFTRFEQDNEGATNLTLARDNVFIVRNTSGAPIAAGKPIYVTGSTGNVPNVALAKADSLTTLPAVGVALDTIADNAFGQAMKLGVISGINTSAFGTGDTVWVSAVTAGVLTNARPAYPNLAQRIGSVLVSGVGNGSLLITVAPFIGGQESGSIATTFTALALLATTVNGNTITNGTGALTLGAGSTLATSATYSITLTSTAATNVTLPTTGTLSTLAGVETLTNKRITSRVLSAANYTTDTGTSLNCDNLDAFIVTAQAGALLFNNPTGTPTEAQALLIRIKDNGTARALTYGAQFRAMGTALPATTVLSKTLYLGFIFNSTDTKWDLVGAAQEA